MKTVKSHINKRKGFTLVELSIVLVIIGLLIGGILVAQSMVSTVRTQKVVRELQQYDILMTNFKSTYKYYPGDLPNAYDLFGSTCGPNWVKGGTPFQADGCNGDGNGVISHCCHPAESDNIIWHMSLANMMPQKYTYLQTDGRYIIGQNVPATPFKNTLYRFLGPDGAVPASYMVTLTAIDTANPQIIIDSPSSFSAISPADALAIDSKMDDGQALAGKVRVSGYYYHTSCMSGSNYNVSVTSPQCSINSYVEGY